jgi:putative Mg2+ transporter-C (MgtC) family protein
MALSAVPAVLGCNSSTVLSTQDILLRLTVAAILGGIVGLERERLEWVAGLRTHMLVCVGAALVMIVSASALPTS